MRLLMDTGRNDSNSKRAWESNITIQLVGAALENFETKLFH